MMLEESDDARRALLPAGLSDALPPEAGHRAAIVHRLIAGFAAQGYDRVEPPLVEFEDNLLALDLSSLASQTFRLMDPVSQRMLGVRADITTQIARIATTRLGAAPRPLRLAYAGDVLRVKGSQLRPERQVTQIGAELIGAPCAAADVEVVRLAADSLADLGVAKLTVDLTVPPLVGLVLAEAGLDRTQAVRVRAALDRKDAGAVAVIAAGAAAALGGLLAATGPAQAALMILTSIDLPASAAAHLDRLTQVVDALAAVLPEVTLTIDPVETRGFEYHSGLGFALFSPGVRGELGRGGRYVAGRPPAGEPSTGFSLFLDAVMQAAPVPMPPRRIFLPFGTPDAAGVALRRAGYVTLSGLEPVPDARAEARRLSCGQVWIDHAIVEVDDAE